MFSISKLGYIITRRSAAEIQVKLFWLAEVQKFVQPKSRVPHLIALIIVATTFVGDILVRANEKKQWAVLKYIYPKLLVGCLKTQYVGACSPKYPCFCSRNKPQIQSLLFAHAIPFVVICCDLNVIDLLLRFESDSCNPLNSKSGWFFLAGPYCCEKFQVSNFLLVVGTVKQRNQLPVSVAI